MTTGTERGATEAKSETPNRYAPKPKIPELPTYIRTAFEVDRRA